MSNLNELKQALKETLEENGSLSKIKAMLRAEIFQAIETDEKPKPQINKETFLLNQLIFEYLRFNNFNHSLSVLMQESGMGLEGELDRDYLKREFNLKVNEKEKIPLLYYLAFGEKNDNQYSNTDAFKMASPTSIGYNPINEPNFSSNIKSHQFTVEDDKPKYWVIDKNEN